MHPWLMIFTFCIFQNFCVILGLTESNRIECRCYENKKVLLVEDGDSKCTGQSSDNLYPLERMDLSISSEIA